MRVAYDRMRSLGMTLVFPGFSGHLPCQLQLVFPDMKLSPRPHWQGFNSSCLLDPSDTEHYKLISHKFLEAQSATFGVSHYYAFDQFNEMEPKANATLGYLKGIASSAYDALTAYDPAAVWVLQAWFLVSNSMCHLSGQNCGTFWQQNVTEPGAVQPYPRAAAYLSGVPHGRLLVLDLEANTYPVYPYTANFYGHDFIW